MKYPESIQIKDIEGLKSVIWEEYYEIEELALEFSEVKSRVTGTSRWTIEKEVILEVTNVSKSLGLPLEKVYYSLYYSDSKNENMGIDDCNHPPFTLNRVRPVVKTITVFE